MLDGVTEPGYHFKAPLITDFHNIQVTVQTDKVQDIPCGTSGGVLISFDKIEVVNRLKKDSVAETVKNYTINYDKTWIFDKIHHEINQFCSKSTLQDVYIDKFDELDESLADALKIEIEKWAPGIEIISVRVTKPRIPKHIQSNYEQMESQKTELLIAEQEQKVVEKKAETERKKNRIEAESLAEISKIQKAKEIEEREAMKKIALIENSIQLEKQKAKADADYYQQSKQAESNSKMYTPEYLRIREIEALSQNTKLYFGNSIPTYLTENLTPVN